METRPRFEAILRCLGFGGMLVCGVGAIAAMTVVVMRVPSLAATKLDVVFGTLQGVAVSLLFGAVALLINLTLMLRRASRRLGAVPWAERTQG